MPLSGIEDAAFVAGAGCELTPASKLGGGATLPGTPPVTLIESPLESSLPADTGAAAPGSDAATAGAAVSGEGFTGLTWAESGIAENAKVIAANASATGANLPTAGSPRLAFF
jgi:hypothetical protein